MLQFSPFLVAFLSCSFRIVLSAAIHSRTSTDDACAQAASAQSNGKYSFGALHTLLSKGIDEVLPPEVAYRCLRSVPLYKEPALELLRSLRGFLQIHSTIDYVATPPPGYLFPAVDLAGTLDSIYSKVENEEYSNEYDLQIDLFLLSRLGKDDHLGFTGDLLNLFSFTRQMDSLISLSEDGLETPSIYMYGDRYNIDEDSVPRVKDSSEYSAIATINGIDVQQFLEIETLTSSSQDPDALYNAALIPSSYNIFTSPTLYPGPETTIGFANGSTQQYPTLVTANKNLTGISSATDVYIKFCVGSEATEEESASEPASAQDSESATGPSLPQNPSPNVYDESGSVQGYWGGDIADKVAVLALLGFGPDKDDTETKFQQAIGSFLQQSTQDGNDKLVIDLRSNGGGTVFLALDTLVQLFPDTNPDTRSNLRASAAMHAIVKNSSDATTRDQDFDPTTGLDETEVSSEYSNAPFAWQPDLTPSGEAFESLDEFYGPYPSGPGQFTSFLQENYTNNDRTLLDSSAFDITDAKPGAKRPYAAEKMVILTDGTCASSCSILVENLKNKFGLMSIAIGGRAQNGPMQTVGGVKGSRLFNGDFMKSWPETYSFEAAKDKSLVDPIFDSWSPAAAQRFQISVNGMNAYRFGDETDTPLHFIYEASDCRIWFTPEMIEDWTVLWNRVADIAFNNRNGNVMSSEYCVSGSTEDPTSISGGLKLGEIGPQKPPKAAFPRFSGWIINGTTIIDDMLPEHDAYGPGTIEGSPIDGSTAADSPIDQAALQNFRDYCSGYSGDAWLLKLMCGALK